MSPVFIDELIPSFCGKGSCEEIYFGNVWLVAGQLPRISWNMDETLWFTDCLVVGKGAEVDEGCGADEVVEGKLGCHGVLPFEGLWVWGTGLVPVRTEKDATLIPTNQVGINAAAIRLSYRSLSLPNLTSKRHVESKWDLLRKQFVMRWLFVRN